MSRSNIMTRIILATVVAFTALAQESEIGALAKKHGVAGNFGLYAFSQKSGASIAAVNESEQLILASNTKLFTTAAAMQIIGKKYSYETTFYLDASNDLVVRAGGDPNISARFFNGDPTALFRSVSEKLGELGVSKIGDVILVNEIFDDDYVYDDWEKYDTGVWYAAPVGAFSLNDNCIDITVSPGKDAAVVKVVPSTEYVKVTNKCVVSGKAVDDPVIARKGAANTINITGKVYAKQKGSPQSIAIVNPTNYFGTVLIETLKSTGVAVAGEMKYVSKLPDNLRKFHVYNSDFMDALKVCNSNSQNFYAEMILKLLGWKQHELGSRENGVKAVAAWAKKIGIDDLAQYDGSGLSRDNKCSAKSIVAMLLFIAKNEKDFFSTLAVAGTSGTVKNRLQSLAGKVMCKTGTLSGVSNISGVILTRSGDEVFFSILVNGSKGKPHEFQDDVIELLYKKN